MLSPQKLKNFFKSIKHKKILIFGDVMLDCYVNGSVKRISPEAPVPILQQQNQDFKLGGAGNVAINLAQLGVKVFLASAIGDENPETNEKLYSLFKKNKINTKFIIEEKGRKTSIKTRVIAGQQQIVRIDIEDLKEVKNRIIDDLVASIEKSKIKFDAIIFSDYGKGVIHPYSWEKFITYAQTNNIFTALDPKQRNFNFYKNLDLMTPNHFEAQDAVSLPSVNERLSERETPKQIYALGKAILLKYSLKNLIITRGSQGMIIFSNQEKNQGELTHHSLPTFNRKLFDVSGAGDTVIAMSVIGYLVWQDIFLASYFANVCAGIVVGKLGAAFPTEQEILDEVKKVKR